jgi:hypothetical protein
VQPPERALQRLRDAYGAGHLSTATLEARAEWVLGGGYVEDALWDLPLPRPRGFATASLGWWRPAAPVRGLVAGGTELQLADRGRWVIGRAPSCDLALPADDTLSRTHAEIAVRAGVCLVRDLDSCNGTWLNGRFVRRAQVRRGDVLQLGETEIRVR